MLARIISVATNHEMDLAATSAISEAMKECISIRGRCTIGLSGGSSPKGTYVAIAGDSTIDWSVVTVFLVDDRYVPRDHPDSNQKLSQETLLANLPTPPQCVVFPNTDDLSHVPCVEDYASQLAEMLSSDPDQLADVLVLGMGPDGHIASLFPPLNFDLFDAERPLAFEMFAPDRFAVHERITTSVALIEGARTKVFLLKADKKGVFEEMVAALDQAGGVVSNELQSRYPAIRLLTDRSCIFVNVFETE